MELMEHQEEALPLMKNGCILWGGMGSGKSATALAYYMKEEAPRPIKVITTAKKRDTLDWEFEAARFGIGTEVGGTVAGLLKVDSWNNIGNYEDCEGEFFIFDEQRVVGFGSWVKSFLKIAKKNHWILLSGTPGDTWQDYMPVFVANGFFRNKTHFETEHVLYEPFRKYPVIRGYLNVRKLELLRNEILVEMPYLKHTEPMHNYLDMGYDMDLYNRIYKDRWHIYEDRPIKDVAELFRVMKRLVYSDRSRLDMIKKLLTCHDRLVIFYNFDFELEILRTLHGDIPVYECNGHRKDDLPEGRDAGTRWVYLVQYMAGSEGWNCTTTDAMVLYSLTYSYKNHMQAMGRIDRLDTPYTWLYYYLFVSNSAVDRAVRRALKEKKSFNERKWAREEGLLEGWEGRGRGDDSKNRSDLTHLTQT